MSAHITHNHVQKTTTNNAVKKTRAGFKPGALWRSRNGNEFRISRDGKRIFFANAAGKRNVVRQDIVDGRPVIAEKYLRHLLNTMPANAGGPARTWFVNYDHGKVRLALRTKVHSVGTVTFPLETQTPSRGVELDFNRPKTFFVAVKELLENARRFETAPTESVKVETLRR